MTGFVRMIVIVVMVADVFEGGTVFVRVIMITMWPVHVVRMLVRVIAAGPVLVGGTSAVVMTVVMVAGVAVGVVVGAYADLAIAMDEVEGSEEEEPDP